MTVRPAAVRHLGALGHGGDLGNADARHDPGGADRTRADAHLDGIGAGVDEGVGGGGAGDVARRRAGRPRSAASSRIASVTPAECPWAVSTTSASTPASISPLARSTTSAPGADRGGHPEPAVVVLGGIGELGPLLQVLDGDETPQVAVCVDHRQLLDLDAAELLTGLVEGGAHRNGDEALAGHQLVDPAIGVVLESKVPVGEDAHQTVVVIGDRHPGDVVLRHQVEGGTDRSGAA